MTTTESDALRDNGLVPGPDGAPRCYWFADMPQHPDYHDREWGQPVGDDQRLFEKICLEGFQSGLSWLTILRKREAFREAFEDFESTRLARYTDADVERLLGNPAIIRNRAKIRSVINNAKQACRMADEVGSLAAWIWSFEPPPTERPATMTLDYLRANPTTPSSRRLSDALKARGWSFVGPTTMYALMQATGLVNDHLAGCVCHATVEAARREFRRPVGVRIR